MPDEKKEINPQIDESCVSCKCEDGKCECGYGKCSSGDECICKDGECKCGKLQNDLAQEKDERLKLLAEFVNYKKRNESEKAGFKIVANNILLKQIIEIIDDFDRAIKVIGDRNKDVIEGIGLIQKKLSSLIDEYGLKALDIKEGDEFSPLTMEAISCVPVKDAKQHNKVLEVMQKGYIYKDGGITFKNAIVVIGKK